MEFKPMGGFPPIKRKNQQLPIKKLDTRGFVSTNIVSIGNILNTTKKEDFISFDDNDGTNSDNMMSRFFSTPNEYSIIDEKLLN